MINKYIPKHLLMLLMIYMSQYVGLSFILTAAVVILRSSGLPLNKLALINIVALPLIGKLFFAVIVDHIACFFKGRYRGWLLLAQSGMCVLLICISYLDITQHFSLVLLLFMLYSIMTCIQDVAIDGLACKIFTKNDRQKANAIQYVGNLLGNIIGGGLILIFYDVLAWQGSLLILAVLTSFSILQLFFYTEPETSSIHTNPLTQQCSDLWKQIGQFLKLNKSWLLLLIIVPSGFSSAYALINPMLVDIGWSTSDIGFITKIYGSVLGVISALTIIPLIKWFGRFGAVHCLMFFQVLALVALLFAYHIPEKINVFLAIGIYSLVQPALLAAISTIMMDKVERLDAKSTFFSLQQSIGVVVGFAYASIAITLVESLGYLTVFILSIILHTTAFILFYICMRERL